MIRSSGGVFEISVDNELIYSKKMVGVFPRDEDILKALKAR